jgi:hypothetical protein
MMQIWKSKRQSFLLGLIFIGTLLLISVGVYNVYKPLPAGLSFAGRIRPVSEIAFYKDLTWVDVEWRGNVIHSRKFLIRLSQ